MGKTCLNNNDEDDEDKEPNYSKWLITDFDNRAVSYVFSIDLFFFSFLFSPFFFVKKK